MNTSSNSRPTAPPPPGSDLNLQDPQVVIDLFHRAAETHLNHPRRTGSCVDLPDAGELLITGDLHDHAPNFHRILRLAQLHRSPDRYLILHEIVHGPNHVNGRDLSIRTLARIAALVLQYPEQVLLLLGNHELAQYHDEGILKNGVSVVEAFDAGVDFLYHEHADDVRQAMNAFIRSMLLAVRCANGVFCSHSLPSPRRIENFDKQILQRIPTDEDLHDGSAYDMVWGRNHNQTLADELAKAWDAKVFITGHQPAEMGYETEGESILILASDHEHGVALPVKLDQSYTRDELIDQIIPLASVIV